jgi:nitrous oxidase accessory protein NosD
MRLLSLLAVGVGLVVVAEWWFVGAQQSQAINVDCTKESLQKAIDKAAPDAVINVSGTCKENFYVTKSLTIRGPSATLASPNQYFPVVAVTNGKLQLLGEPTKPLTISDGDRGVIVVGKGAQAVLDYVTVKENAWGGVLIADGAATVRNSTISGNGVGIAVLDKAEITNNTISGNRGCGVWAVSKAQGWAGDAQVSGSGNTMSNNTGGDLCPPDFKWPQGFKK